MAIIAKKGGMVNQNTPSYDKIYKTGIFYKKRSSTLVDSSLDTKPVYRYTGYDKQHLQHRCFVFTPR